jgi:Spx/MgsR family transcriptional regulator
MAAHLFNNTSMTRMTATVVYGIPNCDTVRKARKWLEQQQVNYHFHDVRAEPVSADAVHSWLQQLGTDTVLNKRSTAWRQLSAEEQAVTSNADVVALLQRHPTLMKRPLLVAGSNYQAGFNEANWRSALELG